MRNYSFFSLDGDTIDPSGIQYGEVDYGTIMVREVFIKGVSKGEFHIRFKVAIQPVDQIRHVRNFVPDNCQVGMVDPSGILSLDYPIYVKCGSEMDRIACDQAFEFIANKFKPMEK